ncbi:hypothetical protein AVEN_101375-1 [Araneus ventricosus]|uniref:Uncharacterized protein n=1 Tax=Araneus ventricosus TaxID=182803 RepID=A0A4Y2W424_ARAVE|nr:hypothetical protein AVEN_85884-1 [Araneus ventricosus]GBO31787.1 hypothetical protein AVEN_101375-1 [Araneus ventricosus]
MLMKDIWIFVEVKRLIEQQYLKQRLNWLPASFIKLLDKEKWRIAVWGKLLSDYHLLNLINNIQTIENCLKLI